MADDRLDPVRRDDARTLWRDYAAATGRAGDEELAVERFGDSAAGA